MKRDNCMSSAYSVVLIPGFMLDEALWDEFKAHLPADWKVIDAPIRGGASIKEIAGRIAAEVAEQHFVLIGFSLGGYVARQLAADYPERVSALVLVASSLREDTEERAQSKAQTLQALSNANFRGLSSGSIAKSLHPDHASDRDLITHIRQMGQRLGYEAFALQSGLRRAGVPAKTISCPTLVIGSTHDSLRSVAESSELAKAIPDALLQLFDGSGHMIPLEQPKELAMAVTRWLPLQKSN